MTRSADPTDVADALRMLAAHDQSVQDFYADPMTRAMGVPVDDFQEDFDARERSILVWIAANAQIDSKPQRMALGRLEKWMP